MFLRSFALLVVPVVELLVGLVPRVVAVSLVQYVAHDVPKLVSCNLDCKGLHLGAVGLT